MEVTSATAILKGVADYGVLGLGWVAWLFTMMYVQRERREHQELVIHIIQYFTKVRLVDKASEHDELPMAPGGFDDPSAIDGFLDRASGGTRGKARRR